MKGVLCKVPPYMFGRYWANPLTCWDAMTAWPREEGARAARHSLRRSDKIPPTGEDREEYGTLEARRRVQPRQAAQSVLVSGVGPVTGGVGGRR